ncbi:MAG: site-2 protease family protein [Gemmatimonadota bacterium]
MFGIELKLDPSWFIVFVLVAWSLGGHYFPTTHPGWSATTYWVMGAATALLLFASIVAHELGHSLVSQRFGTPVKDITLFIFGGAARMSREPSRPREELWMALAGPATSLLVAGGFWLIWSATSQSPGPVHPLSGWVAWINVAVAAFNLIPGFPLDGGRVFRALVWSVTGDLHRATRIASGLGRVVALGFILFGVWQVLGGNFINGLWIAFIGWFLDSAAVQSARHVDMQELLAGHTAREIMMTDCPSTTRDMMLDRLVNEVLLPSGRRCFPVIEDGRLEGLLTLDGIKRIPRERWPSSVVADAMIGSRDLKTVSPEEGLERVLDRMTEDDINQYPVLDDGRFVGMIARDRMLAFLQARTELGA